ncbi:hypothetical protein [Arthrobacter sp. UM1]|uniref:hypothetical protein n=1 Tax=Arthrobacter sp. UM1 TaxID=2766776 RepID=UPI001CF63A8E|nr:hypothetical protein [Arthrobacter sp. UM1]MCB4209215.1 hypothetical protein [Arthrobacter sp. UM1]
MTSIRAVDVGVDGWKKYRIKYIWSIASAIVTIIGAPLLATFVSISYPTAFDIEKFFPKLSEITGELFRYLKLDASVALSAISAIFVLLFTFTGSVDKKQMGNFAPGERDDWLIAEHSKQQLMTGISAFALHGITLGTILSLVDYDWSGSTGPKSGIAENLLIIIISQAGAFAAVARWEDRGVGKLLDSIQLKRRLPLLEAEVNGIKSRWPISSRKFSIGRTSITAVWILLLGVIVDLIVFVATTWICKGHGLRIDPANAFPLFFASVVAVFYVSGCVVLLFVLAESLKTCPRGDNFRWFFVLIAILMSLMEIVLAIYLWGDTGSLAAVFWFYVFPVGYGLSIGLLLTKSRRNRDHGLGEKCYQNSVHSWLRYVLYRLESRIDCCLGSPSSRLEEYYSSRLRASNDKLREINDSLSSYKSGAQSD